jgi:hypothetical protein
LELKTIFEWFLLILGYRRTGRTGEGRGMGMKSPTWSSSIYLGAEVVAQED